MKKLLLVILGAAVLLMAASSTFSDFQVSPRSASAGGTGRVRWYELAANGNSSVDFKAPDSLAATTPYTLPTGYPAVSGYLLSSTTAGVMSWIVAPAPATISIPMQYEFIAAVCQNADAFLGFSTPTANAPTAVCITGTNTQLGAAQFTATGQTVQGRLLLPDDWVSGTTNDVQFVFRSVGTTGNVVWDFATICVAVSESVDPAFNTEQTVSTAAQGTTLRLNSGTISTFTTTGCAAGEVLFFKAGLDSSTTTTGNIDLLSVRFRLKRTITTL